MTIQIADLDIIEKGLLKLKEDDLSKSILVPLFRKIYSCKVEFVGGRVEKGRDIIIHKYDELGDPQLICVQVKKISPSENSSKKNNFQQLINQLSQMKSEAIVSTVTGADILASKIIFITPYIIKQRPADSHQGALRSLLNNKGVRLIDGNEIAKLLITHYPSLLQIILPTQHLIKESIKSTLNNKQLMQAFRLEYVKDIAEIYCDISISPGGKQYVEFFERKLLASPQVSTFVDNAHLDIYAENIGRLRDRFNIFLCEEQQYADITIAAQSAKKNKERWHRNEEKIDDAAYAISNLAQKVGHDAYSKKYVRGNLHHKHNALELCEQLSKRKQELIACLQQSTSDKTLATIVSIGKLVRQLKTQVRRIEFSKSLQEREQLQGADVILNVQRLANNITAMKESLCNPCIENSARLKAYLVSFKETSALIKIANTFRQFISFENNENNDSPLTKLDASIIDVFNTELNVAVLGDAGSGKTTNLQYYAGKLLHSGVDKLVIYATLNKIAKCSASQNRKDLLFGIGAYLSAMIEDTSIASVKEHLKNEKSVILLDSIDEAIIEYPWVVRALVAFSESFPKCQIITSSRYSVKQLKSIPFVNISLLPYDDKQKELFINKWFTNNLTKAKQVIKHLDETPHLSKIVTNPLSATILCVLSENNISLPKTEVSLYKKRFALLSGVFDQYKGISRTKTEPDFLIVVARVLAFELHNMKKRSVKKDKAMAICLNTLESEDSDRVALAVNELISPTEILVPASVNGHYDFGHLRFQEYLASQELVHSDIPFYKLIVDEWWHDTFVLWSQHARRIEKVVNDVCASGYANKAKELLLRMINNRNENEKEKLLPRVNIAIFEGEEGYAEEFLVERDPEPEFESFKDDGY